MASNSGAPSTRGLGSPFLVLHEALGIDAARGVERLQSNRQKPEYDDESHKDKGEQKHRHAVPNPLIGPRNDRPQPDRDAEDESQEMEEEAEKQAPNRGFPDEARRFAQRWKPHAKPHA